MGCFCSTGATAQPGVKLPDSPGVIRYRTEWIYYWDLLIILDVIAVLIIVPLRIGFQLDNLFDWLGPDLFMDTLYLIDIILTFFRTFTIDGEEVTARREIALRYLKGRFAIDFLSILPIEYVALAFSTDPAYGANRLLRISRLVTFLLSWERNSNLKPSIVGIIKIVFVVVYMSHFIGCVFNGLTILVHSTSSFTSTSDWFGRPFWSRYWRSFYWALANLTGYNSSSPVHWSEVLLEDLVTFISVAVFGTIIGVFGNLLTNIDSSKNYFRRKMDGINDYMKYQKIPADLQQDVNRYYSYMWNSGKALENDDAVEGLPANLKQRLNFQTCYMSIRAVPFFIDVRDDMAFMGDVIKVLRPRIGLPNSYIVKKGEMGTEMYFISRGEVNVVADSGVVVFTLQDGTFFGEIALIYKTKRTATIVARTFCDMYILTKDDFAKVMRKYPVQSKGIRDVARKRFEENQRKEEEARKAREDAERAKIAAEQAERKILELGEGLPEGHAADLCVSEELDIDEDDSARPCSPLQPPHIVRDEPSESETYPLNVEFQRNDPTRPQTRESD